MPWSLALDLGSRGVWAASLRDPVDQGQALAGRAHAFAGGTLGGRSLLLLTAGPVLLQGQKAGLGEKDEFIYGRKMNWSSSYLGLRASMVFLLGQVLSAL